jgi:cytochrome bd ubiquinol oxidase subunit II
MSPSALATIVGIVIVVALNAYVLLAGADFGGGVWDLLASGPRRDRQRELISHAIGPVWEANHVWIILVVVLLFTCFPAAFALLSIALHIPLTLVLVGIVLRGSAFAFRSLGGDRRATLRWGRLFASASLVTPLVLGIVLGALAAGRVAPPLPGAFVASFVSPWLTPFGVSLGVFTLALFAFLAAVYLTVESDQGDLQEDFRRRALVAGAVVFVAAMATLALARRDAPLVWQGLVVAPRAGAIHALTAVAAITALVSLYQRRYPLARLAAGGQVSLIIWGWALAQYPYLVPRELTLFNAAAPAITLQLVLGALALGAAVLFPSLRYLLRTFKGREGTAAGG